MLGPLRIQFDDAPFGIDAPRQRLVFGILLANAGELVDASRMLDGVWGDAAPASGRQALRYHVSKLRDRLDPGRARGDPGPITTVGSAYRLDLDRDAVDAHRFEVLAAQGARLVAAGDWEPAQQVLGGALGLWRGEAWEDFRYDDFAQPEIFRLEERRLACREDLVEARLALGDHRALVAELHELTTRHPLRERFWAQAMVAQYRDDQPAEAARTYETARRVLGEELGVEPNASLRRLHRRVVEQSLPVAVPTSPQAERRPVALRTASFVGRIRELSDVAWLLARRRLVTVTGPGGVGKSALAMECARHAPADLGRVVVVELASLGDQGGVLDRIMRALRVERPTGRATVHDVVDHLGDDPYLLVIDNCEHVVSEVAGVVSSLLADVVGLTVLATSRRPLGVEGEHRYPLDPLGLPDLADLDAARGADAVRLLVDRAASARGAFAVGDDDLTEVVELCRRLDGLPLAIELAASRLRVLAVDEVLARLAASHRVLADAGRAQHRHRTLRATMEWSHDLLSDDARVLFRRLAVFRGRFDVPAVEAVVGRLSASDDVLAVAEELVDSSFVVRRDDRVGGLEMLDTIRRHATGRLVRAGEEPEVRARHARYFAERVAAPTSPGRWTEPAVVRRMLVDSDNHAAALDWAVRAGREDLVAGLTAAVPLYWYAVPSGNLDLGGLVSALGRSGEPSVDTARSLCTLGLSLPWMGRRDDAERVADELERVAGRLGVPEHHADVLWVRAAIATAAGDIRGSCRLFGRAAEVLRPRGHPKLATFLFDLAFRHRQLGDPDRADIVADELTDVAVALDLPLARARVTLLRGQAAWFDGDVSTALGQVTAALGEIRRLELVGPQTDALAALCDIAASAADWEVAERAARELRRLLGGNGEVVVRPVADDTLAMAALARGDPFSAGRHVAAGLEVVGRTGAHWSLDHVLLTAATVADSLGRGAAARSLLAGRARRRDEQGLVDAAPVARVAAPPSPQVTSIAPDAELVTLARDAVAG